MDASRVRKVPIKIVRVDNLLDTATISGSSFALGGAAILVSKTVACLALKTALVGSSFMLLAMAIGYLFYHCISSNFLKEAANLVSLQEGFDIDQLVVRQLPVRLYMHNAPFLTDQPIYCPGKEFSDACLSLPYI